MSGASGAGSLIWIVRHQPPHDMAEFLYVDNSNVFIEGKRVSAVKRGIALSIDDAIRCRVLDNDYRMDFGRLHDLIAGRDPSQIKRAVLFGSRPPKNDSL